VTATDARTLPDYDTTVRATGISGHPRNCGCDYCPRLRARYQKERRLKQHRGTWEALTDAAPALAQLREYIAAGWTERQIGYVAGLAPHYIGKLLEPSAGRAATARIRPATADAIRSVAHADRFDPAVPDATFLNPVGSVRRLRALACGDWSQRNLRANYGSAVMRIVEHEYVKAGVARDLRSIFEELWKVPGPSPSAGMWARRRGWVPAAAWEHLGIDDPRSVPDSGADADPTEALVENAEWLRAEFGMSWEAIAAQLGVRKDTLHTYRGRVRERAAASHAGGTP
jgi:hypothetical protein